MERVVIRNGKDIENGAVLKAQVCVVGSGPAGSTAAWHLWKAGLSVLLIEGSRFDGTSYELSWPDKKLLYAGVSAGLFATNEPNFLIQPYAGQSGTAWERERILGGTSTHWGGQSRPLDPVDFEDRPGFPGWPIARAELDPFYAAAAKFMMLHGDDFSGEYWGGVLGDDVPQLQNFDTCMYQFIGKPYLNFATRTFPDGSTLASSGIDTVVNASLLDIERSDGHVTGLRVASMNDATTPGVATEFRIEADAYVLACGAVANAQRLLLSDIGNEHDQVGRYFMCHPLSSGVNISITRPFLTTSQNNLMSGNSANGVHWSDSNGVTVTGRFQLTADAMRQYGIGNCWMRSYSASAYFEMAPNPDSRVTLLDTTDPVFGQREARIDWQLSPLDQTTYETSTQLFKAAVQQLGGDIYAPSWAAVKAAFVVNGHHLGTTRMSADPAQGVVDGDLKVHTMDNLYVAGSSVFATAGVSNPTFTIIALSIRLAEHLARRFASPS